MGKSMVRGTKVGACRSLAQGFSLIEMLVAFAILMVVIAVAVKGMIMMQTRSFTEASKVDMVQETRDFVDQMVHDIHDVGYPPGRVVNNNPNCDNNPNVSCGLIAFSPTAIQYEGDLDGTGTVYEVFIQLSQPASGKCPCTLQRGLVDKLTWLNSGKTKQPDYYTEVNGVLNSGNGSGVPTNSVSAATYPVSLPGNGNYSAYATADVFDAYFNDGSPYWNTTTNSYSCNTLLACGNIRSLQITANVATSFMDQKTKMFPVYAITSKARLNN
jgi:type II secretory pathway pseudopilin PulG